MDTNPGPRKRARLGARRSCTSPAGERRAGSMREHTARIGSECSEGDARGAAGGDVDSAPSTQLVAAPPAAAPPPSPRRVVFLDIDGVLLPFGPDAWAPSGVDPDRPPGVHCFRRECMRALDSILARVPDAEVVLSSTWRCDGAGVGEVLRQFALFGGALRRVTAFDGEHTTDPSNHSARQWEIHEWLARHPGVGDCWVALDDEELVEAGGGGGGGRENARYAAVFRGHAIKVTDATVGLTAGQADRAVAILLGGAAAPAPPTAPPEGVVRHKRRRGEREEAKR